MEALLRLSRRLPATAIVSVLLAASLPGAGALTGDVCCSSFDHVAIDHARVFDATLTHVDVADSFVERVDAHQGSMTRVVLQDADLQGTSLDSAFATRVAVHGSGDIRASTFEGVFIETSNLTQTYVRHAYVRLGSFQDSTVVDSTLSHVTLFSGVRLCNVRIQETGEVVNQDCPVPAWPHEGSHVEYLSQGFTATHLGTSFHHALVRLSYHDGAWSGTCHGMTAGTPAQEGFGPDQATHFERAVSFDPLVMPVPTAAGVLANPQRSAQPVPPNVLAACDPDAIPDVVVQSQLPGFVWHGTNLVSGICAFDHVNWDASRGLVRGWSQHCDVSDPGSPAFFGSFGVLVSTDAPT